MEQEKSLRERCRVNAKESSGGFVGVKANEDGTAVFFPVGYQLPDDEDGIRMDIHNLFGILESFKKEDGTLEMPENEPPCAADFPIRAYLTVIRQFLRTGRYYIETEPQYKTDVKGRISWPRTVRKQKALIQENGSLIFTKMSVRAPSLNADKEITRIHRYCVYEAFEKLGWLYVPFMPERPGVHPGIKESVYILSQKLAGTNNDKEQELFGAMKSMLEYVDVKGADAQFYFGTEHFEAIWEKMIDRAFGIKDKKQYFPRTRWLLDYGKDKDKSPLCPDSIMLYQDKYYVIDAKYYRYGWTGDPKHLPNGTDIYKQVTYGEYLEQAKGVSNDRLFNCFIMPYNKNDNKFGLTANIGNIGEAVGDWRIAPSNPGMKKFERIQGIVMDTRYLMHHYAGTSNQQKKELADCIEKVLVRGPVSWRRYE